MRALLYMLRPVYGRYEYLLPVWALDPAVGKPRGVQQSQQPQPQQLQRQAQDSQPASSPGTPAEPPSNAANGNASATAATTSGAAAGTTTAERSRMRAEAEIGASSFALSPTELKRLNLILGVFVGAHCFHNFTSEVGLLRDIVAVGGVGGLGVGVGAGAGRLV